MKYELNRTYVGAVAEVEVDRGSGEIRVTRFSVVHDCGQVINPDGLRNQVEGNVLHTVSRTLKEELTWDRSMVTSLDWATYPVITFPEVPEIAIELLDRPGERPWGAGEPSAAVIPSAISNAVFDATGVRRAFRASSGMRPAAISRIPVPIASRACATVFAADNVEGEVQGQILVSCGRMRNQLAASFATTLPLKVASGSKKLSAPVGDDLLQHIGVLGGEVVLDPGLVDDRAASRGGCPANGAAWRRPPAGRRRSGAASPRRPPSLPAASR